MQESRVWLLALDRPSRCRCWSWPSPAPDTRGGTPRHARRGTAHRAGPPGSGREVCAPYTRFRCVARRLTAVALPPAAKRPTLALAPGRIRVAIESGPFAAGGRWRRWTPPRLVPSTVFVSAWGPPMRLPPGAPCRLPVAAVATPRWWAARCGRVAVVGRLGAALELVPETVAALQDRATRPTAAAPSLLMHGAGSVAGACLSRSFAIAAVVPGPAIEVPFGSPLRLRLSARRDGSPSPWGRSTVPYRHLWTSAPRAPCLAAERDPSTLCILLVDLRTAIPISGSCASSA